MLRKLICGTAILTLCVGIALADEISAVITKVEGNKVTFAERKGFGKDVEKGPEKTLEVADNVKVTKGKFNIDTKKLEAGDALDKGLKNEMFSKEKIGERGLFSTVVTDKDNKKITEIHVLDFSGFKGKGGFKKKDQ